LPKTYFTEASKLIIIILSYVAIGFKQSVIFIECQFNDDFTSTFSI